MKLKNCLLSVLMVIGSVSPNLANATDWDWGGYVAVNDSPVVGGATYVFSPRYTSGWSTTNATISIRAFGKVAYTGTMNSCYAWNGDTICSPNNGYATADPMTCPTNTAKIEIGSGGYVRPDTGVLFGGLYSSRFSEGRTITYVCAQTDTY